MSNLKILQYNVRKSKKVMEPLLADPRTRSYDIIALQEPWRNPNQNRTYCPGSSGFLPAYDDVERRSCFLVNREVDSTIWTVQFPSPDLSVLCLRTEQGNIWIYNVYSEPPGNYQNTEYSTPIPLLEDLLRRDGEHIVLGDFNLHHPTWCGIRNPTQHTAAESLLNILYPNGLSLASPQAVPTWEARGLSSTIDLTFLTSNLQERVCQCQVRTDLDFGSDHYPISTYIIMESVRLPYQPRRCWKRMDHDIVSAGAVYTPAPPTFRTAQDIDNYTATLTRFTQELVDQAVPWSKPSSYGQPWWTTEVQEAVQAERLARRRQDWDAYHTASRTKARTIHQAKRKCFREMIHEATQGDGIWGLARWGRASEGPAALPIMPDLITDTGTARSIPEKADALRTKFYPEVQADITDIQDTTFQDNTFIGSFDIDQVVTHHEISALLRTRRANKAPGSDSISNDFLKAMGEPLANAVACIATACWQLGHYPAQLKHARTIVLRKPNKQSYEEPGSWRPIALLNTIGKLIEAVTAKRIQTIAEEHHLLPDTQMGARRFRSTETALELLTEQVYTVWKSPKHVATLLSLDLSGAFDTVHPIRMLDILRKKGFPGWLVRWVRAFLTDRTTTLVIQGKESPPFAIKAGVPQGSTLSPILFTFYAHELLEICNQPKARISAIGFADDTNILTYGTSTESNCRTLERIHEKCLEWAERHGMKFSPGKYELTHFTRSRTKFNLAAGVNFGSIRKEPSGEVRILGVWLDTKLTWSAHARKVTRKAASQIGALTRLTASTWGASFARSRQIYSSIVRPMLAYGAASWHSPTEGKAKGVAAKLRTVQNKCLRTIAGAYRATPIQALETETFIPPIDLYLDSRIAAFQRRLQASPTYDQIQKACQAIARRLKLRKPRTTQTQGQRRAEWTVNRDTELGEDTPEVKKILQTWTNRWQAIPRTEWDQIHRPPDKGILKLHSKLRKAESTILIHMRTGRTGLAHFLHKAKVPGWDSGVCECGQALETPRHVLLYCPRERERRTEFGERADFVRLLDTPEGAGIASRWMIQSGRLRQFQVANSLLYE